MHEPIHKTLIIRFSSVGDIVLSSLLVRALRQRFPLIQIDYLVKSEFAELVRYNPHVSRIVEFPNNGTFADLVTLRSQVRDSRYDVIIDIHDSLRSRFLCGGMKQVVRISKRKFARFLLVHFKWNAYRLFGGAPSVAERYLEPLIQFGVANDGHGLELFVPDQARKTAHEALQLGGVPDGKQLLGVCPSARHNTKIWPKERFAETTGALAERYGAAVVLFGSKADERRCIEIEALLRSQHPGLTIKTLAGKLSLMETAAAMDRCSLVLTNDSGLMHVAAARKRKVVAIFGSTVEEFGFFPYRTESIVVENIELACRPCTHIGRSSCPKGHFNCMNGIATSRVIKSAQALLAG